MSFFQNFWVRINDTDETILIFFVATIILSYLQLFLQLYFYLLSRVKYEVSVF